MARLHRRQVVCIVADMTYDRSQRQTFGFLVHALAMLALIVSAGSAVIL